MLLLKGIGKSSRGCSIIAVLCDGSIVGAGVDCPNEGGDCPKADIRASDTDVEPSSSSLRGAGCGSFLGPDRELQQIPIGHSGSGNQDRAADRLLWHSTLDRLCVRVSARNMILSGSQYEYLRWQVDVIIGWNLP